MNARNIEISYLSADNNGDRFPALIDECLALKPDVIAVTTTPAAHLLKKATRNIPIVMVALGDPLGTGLVDSLSRPSENITGMSLMVPEMAVKRLELLRELIPGISRVLVLSFLADPIAPIQVKAMEQPVALASLFKFKTYERPTTFRPHTRQEAERVLKVFCNRREHVHCASRSTDEFAARYKLPAIYPFLLPVTDAGGLMAYAVHAPELHRNAAVYVDRILKGAKVSDLPVQQPTKFDLVINLKTAKTLGLKFRQRCSPAPTR